MKNMSKVVLVIVLVAIFSGLIYLQTEIENIESSQATPSPQPTAPKPSPTLTPTSTPASTSVPVATVTANINATPTRVAPNSGGDVLIINGTVTNNSPNTAYNVGLRVTAFGSFTLLPAQEVIDMTIPISSGTYAMGTDYALSTLTPHQSVPVNITIVPYYSSQEPMLSGVNVTVVWSNMP